MQTDTRTESEAASSIQAPLSPTVRSLGFVSFFTDISSEMVYPVNPVFLTRVLGAAPWALGIVEGTAESAASLLMLLSGWMSDRAGRRKPLTLFGYGASSVAKPLMALSGNWGHVLVARLLDRIGKGLRSAPRDALIAENAAPEQRGRAFGFHRGMDTAGAVLGPLIGWAFLTWTHDDFRGLYKLAFLPAVMGVFVLAWFVREKPKTKSELTPAIDDRAIDQPDRAGVAASKREGSRVSPVFMRFLWIVGLFSIGNSSDAFLLLRAQGMGVAADRLMLLYAAFNVVEAALAYTTGKLSDRIGRKPILVAGFCVFGVVYLGFAALTGAEFAWGLFLLYGLYYTLTQGVQRALAADLSDPERRATDIGAYHMVIGLFALPASIIAGVLYTYVSPVAPFYLGAATGISSALLLSIVLTNRPRPGTLTRE